MEDKSGFYIVALIAIVAVVALVVMTIHGTPSSYTSTAQFSPLPSGQIGNTIAPIIHTSYVSCNDSDFGLNIYTAGSVSGLRIDDSNYTYPDTCSGTASVIEQYCNGTAPMQKTLACGAGYYCNGGACKQPVCGNGIVEGTEKCDLGSNNGVCPKTCSSACTLNACIVNSCYDSDFGLNYNVKGYVNVTNSSGTKTSWDVCNGNNVTEYYCVGSNSATKSNYCVNGCNNGACNTTTIIYRNVCTDSDGPSNFQVSGNVTWTNGSILRDVCSGNTAYDAYCGTGQYENWTLYNSTNCQNGCINNGVCNTTQQNGTLVINTNPAYAYLGISQVLSPVGSRSVARGLGKTPRIYSLTPGTYWIDSVSADGYNTYGPEARFTISAGQTISRTIALAYNNTCYDSDGGLNYTVGGNTTGYYYGYMYYAPDVCVIGTSLLNESYCNGTYSTSVAYNCTQSGQICSNSRCQ